MTRTVFRRTFLPTLILFACSVLSTCSTAAWAVGDQPLSFTFFQDGYAEGAAISGTFSGFDFDNNGILLHTPTNNQNPLPVKVNELTSFSLSFSGNSFVPAFEVSTTDPSFNFPLQTPIDLDDVLVALIFDVDSGNFGDDPIFLPVLGDDIFGNISAVAANFFYATDFGPRQTNLSYLFKPIDIRNPAPGNIFDTVLDRSSSIVLVTQIPEPASLMLLATMGLAAVAVRRRF